MTKKEEAEAKRAEKLKAEKERVESLCEFEKKYSDCEYICGIDEVGRGPLAGPVMTAAVILPKDSITGTCSLHGFRKPSIAVLYFSVASSTGIVSRYKFLFPIVLQRRDFHCLSFLQTFFIRIDHHIPVCFREHADQA